MVQVLSQQKLMKMGLKRQDLDLNWFSSITDFGLNKIRTLLDHSHDVSVFEMPIFGRCVLL